MQALISLHESASSCESTLIAYVIMPFLDGFFENLTFKIVMSGRAGGWWADVGHWASSEVYLLVNIFEKTMLLGIFSCFLFGEAHTLFVRLIIIAVFSFLTGITSISWPSRSSCHLYTEMVQRLQRQEDICTKTIWTVWKGTLLGYVNLCPAEHRYTLLLQTV